MQIKCPKCSTVLKVANPQSGAKVKCPKCATVMKLGGSAAGQQSPSKPAPAQRAPAKQAPARKKPKQPVATPPQKQQPSAAAASPAPAASPMAAAQGSPAGSFDFLDLPEPATAEVQQFAQAAAPQAYVPPAAGSLGAKKPAAEPPTEEKGGGMSKGLIAAIAGGVAFVLILVATGGVLLTRGGSSGGNQAAAKPAKAEAPPGFSFVEFYGVSVFLPDGEELETKPSSMDSKLIITPMGTSFFFGSTQAENKEMEDDKLKRRVDTLLASGVIIAGQCERGGVKGKKCILDQSLFLPRMDAEIYQDSGRIIVIGVSSGGGGYGNTVVGQVSEPELQKQFFDSFTVGPAPPRSLW